MVTELLLPPLTLWCMVLFFGVILFFCMREDVFEALCSSSQFSCSKLESATIFLLLLLLSRCCSSALVETKLAAPRECFFYMGSIMRFGDNQILVLKVFMKGELYTLTGPEMLWRVSVFQVWTVHLLQCSNSSLVYWWWSPTWQQFHQHFSLSTSCSNVESFFRAWKCGFVVFSSPSAHWAWVAAAGAVAAAIGLRA